ncbi:T9SS type B sorting domain-containing protein [Chryseobacterium limigenitum]|uniref:Gliding motility-associated C-terminal domain-containing protein n=1 Tax=Chryseobacterium limigenitum TaxID=1612149 RepID=A0A1K2IU74_9FLAO|nr:gliding motility-associated C-terminal domain-containing protein [Chryseobacterium limigenitum]SFZ95736.1 gliding motility-associated C-terminal domain-containing protein [Chryseobacterium limigenitum]
MKKFLLAVCTFLCLFANAQLDTEHWFAPMSASSLQGTPECYLYLSTNETTPFSVQIYNNNAVYSTVQVSKGNPVQVTIPSNFMIASTLSNLFNSRPMGLQVKGNKKFFANFRFGVPNQAEIITSKGLAGVGKNFFIGLAPNTTAKPYVNSTIGVIATEDNTTVTLSGYNPNVVFSDGNSAPSRTFTINKGRSYIIEAQSDLATSNLNGLVGAKLVANKPVSVTNGNFNSIYTTQNNSNVDVLMDQAVPVERLGKDFVMVKGNGPAASGMEAALVVATVNNTKLTVNGNLLNSVTLNAGQYYIVQGTNYINQGNGNYNMSISATNNVYIYQLLAGTSGSTVYATGGMNFIPPLSCFLPKEINEIGFINKIGNTSYDTKLNIITQTGATVTFNGNNIAAGNGPYPVTGNPNWVTYSIPNVTGNVTVNSTLPVTAGIAAGNGAVGYGGYFAGFSSVPAITKTGDCYAGVLLQVDSNYDAYQWYFNGVLIPGATSYSINPELYGAGDYTCQITKNNCETRLTAIYNYTLCPPITTTTYNIGSCNTKVITPAFTSSTQAIIPSLTSIISPPTSGTATVNPTTGQITYTPNAGITANTTDTFIYYIQGNGNPFSFEYFKIIINTNVLNVNNSSLSSCTNASGNGTYNLTTASVSADTGTTVTYFTNPNLTGQITNPTTYSGPAGIIYANVTSQYGCSKTAQITLTANPSPNTNNASLTSCTGTSGNGTYNLTLANVSSDPGITITYFTNSNLTGQITNPTTYSGPAGIIYVNVTSSAGCSKTAQITLTVNPLPNANNGSLSSCAGTNGNGTYNLTLANVSSDPGITISYFTNSNLTGQITNPTTYSGPAGIIYANVTSSAGCSKIAQITLTVNPFPNVNNGSLTSCAGTNGNGTYNLTSVNVSSDPGITITYFTNSNLTGQITNPTTYSGPAGIIYANVTSSAGCSKIAQITVTATPSPNINTNNYNATLCDNSFEGTISVNFATVTPQIVTNSGNFTVRYYLNQADANAGNNNTLPTTWTYTTNTTVYVRVDNNPTNCPPAFGQINFKIGNRIPLLSSTVNAEICDNDINGSETVNLNDYKNVFTNNPAVTLTFHTSLANAQTGTNVISPTQIINSAGTFYIRFTSATECPNIGILNIKLKTPKKSTTLRDQIICSNEKVILDAGTGFTSYLWSNGATTQTITVGAGNYYVDLGFNGCIYRQTVTVATAQAPTITSITVSGTTATVNVSGGTAPYKYSLNDIDYQASNVFTGLSRGIHTVYVLGADRCQPVTKEFLVLNLINAITPNGDGKNDVLNYSDLRIKQNVTIEVVDRYGAAVYKSSDKNYIWDGKSNGRTLPTGTYWYILKWIEPDTKLPVSYSGWILIKNRE